MRQAIKVTYCKARKIFSNLDRHGSLQRAILLHWVLIELSEHCPSHRERTSMSCRRLRLSLGCLRCYNNELLMKGYFYFKSWMTLWRVDNCLINYAMFWLMKIIENLAEVTGGWWLNFHFKFSLQKYREKLLSIVSLHKKLITTVIVDFIALQLLKSNIN